MPNLSKVLVQTTLANSEDPDQTAPKEQSDQGLHCLLTFLTFCKTYPDMTIRFVRFFFKNGKISFKSPGKME